MKMIVIGGSAGALEPMKIILGGLPTDFDAAVLVLRHSWPTVPTLLAEVLRPASALPVEVVADGAPILPGRVHVAPSGTNVTFDRDADDDEGGRFVLSPCGEAQRGRPNIDVSLCAAAHAFGTDCIGVILSGFLDDGTVGAVEVGEYRGTIIAQSPSDAREASMPLNVIHRDSPDYVLPDIQIASTLVALAREIVPGGLRAAAGDGRELPL